MAAEFIDELDAFYLELEKCSFERALDRNAQAIVDTYGMMGFIENNGLHQFWSAVEDEDHETRVIESFKIVGADDIALHLTKLVWVREVLERGLDEHGHYRFSKEEEATLDAAEKIIFKSFVGFPTKLWELAKQLKTEK